MRKLICLLLLTTAILLGCDEARLATSGAHIAATTSLKDLPQNTRLVVGRNVIGLRSPSYITPTQNHNGASLEVHYDPVYVAEGHFYQENGKGLTNVETKETVSFDAFFGRTPVYVMWSPDSSRLWAVSATLYEVQSQAEFPLHVDYAPAYDTDTTIDYIRFAHDRKFLHTLAPYDQLALHIDNKITVMKWQQLTVADLLRAMGPTARIILK